MRRICAAMLTAAATVALGWGASAATAITDAPGGAAAPASPQAGGLEYGVDSVSLARPVISALSVPSSAVAGAPPRVTLRIDERGVGTVYLQVTIVNAVTHAAAVSANLGWSHTGRTLGVRWPAGAKLAAGSYLITVSARDHHGGTLLRRVHASGHAALSIVAPVSKPVAKPAPATPAPPAEPAPTQSGVPTPAQTLPGAVFPVAGPHSFGGPENRFGAPRGEHIHQGQDVLSEEGTPVVAPLSGRIESTSYQAGGAGYYLVEHTAIGFDLMFAHCQAQTFAVSAGQGVSPGQALCHAGQTGDATAPHLHFEIWVGGWQAPGGHPIDPLPYLEAWEHG